MMKNKLLILFALGLSVLLSGCLKEDTCSNSGGEEGTLRLILSIGDPKDVQTRSEASSDERWINNLVVLIFDKNSGRYKDGEIIMGGSESLSGNNGDQSRILTSALTPAIGDKLVLLVNVAGVSSIPLQKDISTTDDINHVFNMGVLNPLMAEHGLPMSGEILYSPRDICRLTRSVAKIQLALAPELSNPDNDVTGTFYYGAEYIRWGMSASLSDQMGAVYAPDVWECVVKPGVELEFPGSGLDYSVVGATGTDVFYMPEYPSARNAKRTPVDENTFHADRTCMLVQVSGKYYRLDLYDRRYIDIRRNTHITVTIKKVKSQGYATAEEALAAPGSNLEYEIHVTGDNGDIVISNGQYAIAIGHVTIDIWSNDKEHEVTTARYILPAELTELSGVTNSISASDDIELLSGNTLTDTDSPIRIAFKDTNMQMGMITIRLGNITQDIIVRSHGPVDSHFTFSTVRLIGSYISNIEQFTMHRNDNEATVSIGRAAMGDSITIRYPENVTPVSWQVRLSDGSYANGVGTDPNAMPVFEDKMIDVSYYCFPEDENGIILSAVRRRHRIIGKQLAPIYIGRFGSPDDPSDTVADTDNDGFTKKRMIVEVVEEQGAKKWSSESLNRQFYTSFKQHDWGQDITAYIGNTYAARQAPAVFDCYLKNDRNGNGLIDSDEPIVWYLPAVSQAIGLWGVYNQVLRIKSEFYGSYWFSTEFNYEQSYFVAFGDGYLHIGHKSGEGRTRCVRDI